MSKSNDVETVETVEGAEATRIGYEKGEGRIATFWPGIMPPFSAWKRD